MTGYRAHAAKVVADLEALPHDVRIALEDALESDERVSWIERPSPRRSAWGERGFLPIGVFFLALGALLGLGAVAILGGAFTHPARIAEIVGALVSVPVVAFVGYIVGSVGWELSIRPWQAARRAPRTVQAITDRRVIVVEPHGSAYVARSTRPFGPVQASIVADGRAVFVREPGVDDDRAAIVLEVADPNDVARRVNELVARAGAPAPNVRVAPPQEPAGESLHSTREREAAAGRR